MFIRKPAACASAIWFCRIRRKSWLYGSEWKYRLAGATAYLRSHGRTVIAARSGMLTHSSSCGSELPHALQRSDRVQLRSCRRVCQVLDRHAFRLRDPVHVGVGTEHVPDAARREIPLHFLDTGHPCAPCRVPCLTHPMLVLSGDCLVTEQPALPDCDQHAAQHPLAVFGSHVDGRGAADLYRAA